MKDAEIALNHVDFRLADWRLSELMRTPQSDSTDMQLSGWLSEDQVIMSEHLGENVLTWAELDNGHSCIQITDTRVTVEVKGYGQPRKFIKIRWPHHDAEGED